MNARILRVCLLWTLVGALIWLVWCWSFSPALAVAGSVLWLSWPGLLLATQMLLMRSVARASRTPVPSWGVMLAAWLNEWRLALLLFVWRMPFRSQAEADGWPDGERLAHDQVGLVLVHGFMCNRAAWTPWLRRLKARGIACAAVTLEPAQGAHVDAMVPSLDACVRRMVQATGRAPLIVTHSMGGLVARAWLAGLAPAQRRELAAHVVTLATPHHGLWLARFVNRLPGLDMREGGEWLQRLGPPARDVDFTCWWSSCDNIVFPVPVASLEGHEQHGLADLAHMQLIYDARVWQFCLELRQKLQDQSKDELLARSSS
ncbi:esterase/lipase family protein [Comamonas composti]|uniref:esterase/lipase family protein n=1 Tax=Comamonas composti TaxID=408558 RepID=UPI0004203A39|nr:alpha/beta fold hydrolase [Comamonas composti]